MRPHPAGLLRPSSVGLRIRKPGLPMPAAEWFEFSSFSPGAGIRSQIQEIRRKAKLALIKKVALASGQRTRRLGPACLPIIRRVDEDVAIRIPHSPGCADFPLPVLHGRALLAKV